MRFLQIVCYLALFTAAFCVLALNVNNCNKMQRNDRVRKFNNAQRIERELRQRKEREKAEEQQRREREKRQAELKARFDFELRVEELDGLLFGNTIRCALFIPREKYQQRVEAVRKTPLAEHPPIHLHIFGLSLPSTTVEGRIFLVPNLDRIPLLKAESGYVNSFSITKDKSVGTPINTCFNLTPTISRLVLETDWFVSQRPIRVLIVGVDTKDPSGPAYQIPFSRARIEVK